MNDADASPNVGVAGFNGVPQKFQAQDALKVKVGETINPIYYSTGLISSAYRLLLPMAAFEIYKLTNLKNIA